MQTFGGPARQIQQKGCFYYGGPNQQRRVFDTDKIPPFQTLIKNRTLFERRFYLNNSNTKTVTMGVVPATKILSEDAPGFYFEVFLTGDKCAPLPLGGLKGLSTLMTTIRDIPEFSKIPPIATTIQPGENILISIVDFAKDVSTFTFLFTSFFHFISISFILINISIFFRCIKSRMRIWMTRNLFFWLKPDYMK